MTEIGREILSAEEVRVLDAGYQGFPAFSEWANAPVAADLWNATLTLLSERKMSADPGAYDQLVEQAMRAAAIDTGAIEGLYPADRGFTWSVMSVASAWVAAVSDEKGPHAAALVEAQRRAYDLAFDAATGKTPMSEMWIRSFHEVACAPQDSYRATTAHGTQPQELPEGAYKKYPNHVRKVDGSAHSFAPVGETPFEMHRFVQELRSETFVAAHPVLQAAYAHYALTAIHPFADGNGRVARVLASVHLLRAVSLPFVVYADQKGAYLDALAAADEGNRDAFVSFVTFQMVDLQRDLAERLMMAATPSIDESLSRVRRAFRSHGGLTAAEVDLTAQRLFEEMRNILQVQLGRMVLPPGIERQNLIASTAGDVVPGYRPLPDQAASGFIVQANAPASVRVEELLYVHIATGADEDFAFRLRRLGRPDVLDVRLGEVHPVVSEAFRLRLSLWVERLIRAALADFASLAERAMPAG